MDKFAYYSQAHQALTYKFQTEHYRRYRGKLNSDGTGNTMCALYWQLNDVWAAPTWSSIDFNLQWKMAHYEAKRFFAPLIIALFSTETDNLKLTVVNDGRANAPEGILTLFQYGWGSKFDPTYKEKKTIQIPESGSLDVLITKK